MRLRKQEQPVIASRGHGDNNEGEKEDGLSLPITFLTISAFLSLWAFFIWVSSRLSAELCTRALVGTWTNCEAVS